MFSEIEQDLKLSEFERNWHSKRTKLGKIFWTLSMSNYAFKNGCVDFGSEVLAYKNLFYKPEEMYYSIVDHFDGIATRKLKKLSLSDQISAYEARIRKQMGDFFPFYQQEIMKATSDNTKSANLIDITFLDKHHPQLEKVSDCLELIYISDKIHDGNAITLNCQLSPSKVRELNQRMDKIIKLDIILSAVRRIKNDIQYQTTYSPYIYVESATEALDNALKFNNLDLSKMYDKRIQYVLKLKYRTKQGEELTSVRKAIKRWRRTNASTNS